MKRLSLILTVFLALTACSNQTVEKKTYFIPDSPSTVVIHVDTIVNESRTLTNSFEESYAISNPSIKYNYENEKQIHNYSNNWDFDKDGKLDEVYFIGTSGAHLYYYLRVVLSSDNIARDYEFIQSDLPILPSNTELNNPDFNPKNNNTLFAVHDYDKDGTNDIFIRLDNSSFQSNKKTLNENGVNSSLLVLTFNNGKAIIKDFSNSK